MRTLLERLLRLVMPADDASALLGDLEEHYQTSRRQQGRLRARVAFLREIAAAMLHADTPRPPRRLPFVAADLRYALRRWRRRPGFALAAIATLAIGIGATTAIHSVIDTVLLAPPPWTDPDRLVAIHAVFPDRRQNPLYGTTWNRGRFSYPGWDALRERPEFESVAAWSRSGLEMTLGAERTALIDTIDVSSQFFATLGIPIAMGRSFTPAEDSEPSSGVIITHEAWQRRFGGREDIIGHADYVGHYSTGEQRSMTIVGVVARGFTFDGRPVPELFVPIGIPSRVAHQYPSPSLRVVARLAPGVTAERGAAAADAVAVAVERSEPTHARVLPLVDDQWRGQARPLWLLFGAAALLLAIACANVAGLLLGDARARRHELAVRAALGGSRARVVRQLLVEHLLLALAGAAGGMALAVAFMQAFVAAAPAALPRVDTLTLDARVVGVALTLGLITLLFFGVAPALLIARTPAAALLAQNGRDGGPGRLSGQRVIAAGAMALALVLLVGAHLLAESLYRLTTRPLGFAPDGLVSLAFRETGLPKSMMLGPLSAGEYEAMSPAERLARSDKAFEIRSAGWARHIEGAMARLAGLPGVVSVAGSYATPFMPGRRATADLRLADQPDSPTIAARLMMITPDFFDTMGVPLLRGRRLQSSDRVGDGRLLPNRPIPPRGAVISRELERRLFGGDGTGKQIIQVSGQYRIPIDVAGVVDDLRWNGYADDDLATMYVVATSLNALNAFVIRLSSDAEAPFRAVRETLSDYDPQLVVTTLTPMTTIVGRSIAEERLRASLSTIFGGAALALAAVGLYGLAARRVADRRREIGVRVALGARTRDVRRLVVRDAALTLAAGLAVGLPLAFAVSRITQSMLFGVDATAPRIFATATVVLVMAAAAATVQPVRRAAAIDPIMVLKE